MKRIIILTILTLIASSVSVHANTTSPGLIWEDPLRVIMESLTGPVAFAISLIGVAITCATLIFGGELGEFSRRIVMLVLVMSVMLGASNFVTQLFGATSALVL